MKLKGSLSKYILDNITEEIYWRGFKYFQAGKVDNLIESDKKCKALVYGTEDYQIEFRQGPKYIKGYCNCPYFESNEDYCKHIAAVAIAHDFGSN